MFIGALIGSFLGNWAFALKKKSMDQDLIMDRILLAFTPLILEEREVPKGFESSDTDPRLIILRLLADNNYLSHLETPYFGNDAYVHKLRMIYLKACAQVQSDTGIRIIPSQLTRPMAYKLQKELGLKKHKVQDVSGTHDWMNQPLSKFTA